MTSPRDDAALDELLGAFALDAVDAQEAEEIERYLQRSPRARAEVAAHREVAALLVATGSDAPSGVWERISGSLDGGPVAPEAPRLGATVRAIGDAPSARRSVSLRLAVAVTGAAAALVAVFGIQVARQGDELDAQHEELAALDLRLAERDVAILAAQARQDPTNRVTVLSSEDEDLVVTTVMGDDGQGFLLAENLPELAVGRSYQLWGIVDDRTVSLGLLQEPGVVAFHVDGPMDGYAITEEVAGGVATSEQVPTVVGLTEAR